MSFYDVAVSPGSNFTLVSVQICGVATGSTIEWQNPMTHVFTAVSDQSISASTACASVTVTPTSTPDIAELYGSIFAVLLANSLPNPAISGSTSFRVSHQGASEFGAPVRYSARLSNNGEPVSSGVVRFSVGATVLCSARVADGNAACTSRRAPRSGAMVVVGRYFSSPNGTLLLTARARMTVTQDPALINAAQLVTRRSRPASWIVTVTARRPGSGQPRGWLAVSEGGRIFDVALRSGRAEFGSIGNTVVVKYHGGRDFNAAESTFDAH